MSLKAGESKTINGIPTGTECQVTEVKPTDPPAGWSFSDPVYDPASGKVTVTEKDKTVSMTVTHEILKPGINIVKTGSATQVNKDENVTYTYTVTNTGDTELLNVKVEDDKCGPATY